ncbi:sister chromatid cohesion C-terminus-domain-containing protein [Syncephalis plumigaleata]|nr:sister chromatid cohesion C-terminus-domain-containing protein [Syncephalis plumigaleata]
MPATIDQSLWSSWLQTVIDHLQDTVSIGIRDTALGIIGQLCLTRDDPVLLQQCYPLIQARVMDVGVSVRKHAIRLLKDIYAQVEDESIKTNIALCLLHQIEDVDPSIIKLCHQQLQSIWLSDLSLVSASITTSNQASTLHSGYHHLTTSDQILLKHRLHIMGQSMKQCATTYRYRLAKVFEKALDTTSRNRKARTQLYQWYVHWYMEQLLSTTTESVSYGYDLVLVQLARVVPELFIYHLPNLCLYISSITYQEYDLAESIIHIIRSTLPVLRQIDSKLMLTLQSNLTNLLLKGSQSLIELAVPCLCMIITRYTRQHMYLLRLWTASIKRITDEEVYYQEKRTFQSLRHLLRLLLAIGLICLHYRVTDTRPIELAKQCSLLKEKTFHLVIRFMHQPYEPAIQTYALKSMGYLYQAYPAWLTNEQSTSIIQRILTNNDQIMIRVQLMKVFASLLSSSLEGQEGHDDKTIEKQEAIFMHTQLEDDGLTPGLIHKYVDAILEATLHQHPLLHETAFQVIRLALQQGIIHPFKCMPAVVAVMASPYKKVRQCAIDLFALMDGKHASFLYQRLNEYIEALFVYRHRCCISLGVQSELTGLFGPEEIGPTSPRPEPVTASLYRFVQSRKAHCSSLIKLMVERIKKCNDTTLLVLVHHTTHMIVV